jgi:hypothetical protein
VSKRESSPLKYIEEAEVFNQFAQDQMLETKVSAFTSKYGYHDYQEKGSALTAQSSLNTSKSPLMLKDDSSTGFVADKF